VREVCAPVEGRWGDAARCATSDADLGRAALGCLELAVEALARRGAPELAIAVTAFAERFTSRGRCPADEVVELTGPAVWSQVVPA
jgi:glutamate--cysteine ligase